MGFFLGISMPFPTVVPLFYIKTSTTQGLQFLCILTNMYYFPFLFPPTVVILMDMK